MSHFKETFQNCERLVATATNLLPSTPAPRIREVGQYQEIRELTRDAIAKGIIREPARATPTDDDPDDDDDIEGAPPPPCQSGLESLGGADAVRKIIEDAISDGLMQLPPPKRLRGSPQAKESL